jgi:hypothetical protein
VHWLAYACWPVALLHGLGSGSDIRGGFAFFLSLGCTLAVAIAIVARLLGTGGQPAAAGLAALAATGVALALWLPAGPLAPGWAARAGTPPSDLAAARGKQPPRSKRTAAAPAPVLHQQVVASLAGRVSQVVDPNGGAVIRFTLALDRGPLRHLQVELHGQAQPGGGISLSRGRVVLGTPTMPALFTGPVASLQGSHLSASLHGQGTSGLSLALTLTHLGAAQVTGRATLVPTVGGR